MKNDNIIKSIKKVLLFLALSLGFLVFEVVFYIIGIDFDNMTLKTSIILTYIKYFFFLGLLILIYHKYLIEKWKDFQKNFTNYFDLSFKYWITGLIVMYVANLIIMSMMNSVGSNEEIVQNIITSFPIAAFFMTTFFAPVIEELIFRKSLQDAVPIKIIFPLISGLIFGYIHVMGSTNPIEYLMIISYGSLGYSFGYILNKTDNIYCTIMMHMIHNGILTLLQVIL